MEFTKKYALIPEDSLSKHVPTQKQMTEFDKQMEKILNSSLEDSEKIQRYYELLNRKMNTEKFNLPWLTTKEDTKKEELKGETATDYDSIILNSVPTPMQRKAGNALSIVKKNPDILTWNNRGEIIHHGKKLPETNIADLFNILFTDKKHVNIPAIDTLLSALHELNFPKQYIKNKYLNLNTLLDDKKDVVPIIEKNKKSIVTPVIKQKRKSDVPPVIKQKKKPHVKWETY